jgi:hypothetical protein
MMLLTGFEVNMGAFGSGFYGLVWLLGKWWKGREKRVRIICVLVS